MLDPSPIVLVKNNKILFSNENLVTSGSGVIIPLHEYLTTLGFIIPSDYKSITPFKLKGLSLSNNDAVVSSLNAYVIQDNLSENAKSIILDNCGNLYLISMVKSEPFEFRATYVPYGINVEWVFANDQEIHDISHTALKLSRDLDEAFSIICKTVPLNVRRSYCIYDILELAAWTSECLDAKKMKPFDGTITVPTYIQQENAGEAIIL